MMKPPGCFSQTIDVSFTDNVDEQLPFFPQHYKELSSMFNDLKFDSSALIGTTSCTSSLYVKDDHSTASTKEGHTEAMLHSEDEWFSEVSTCSKDLPMYITSNESTLAWLQGNPFDWNGDPPLVQVNHIKPLEQMPSIATLAKTRNDSMLWLDAKKSTQTNAGSYGHPELCHRPCLYFSSGSCNTGNDCNFCHQHHSLRPSHLDKRNREAYRALTMQSRAALVWSAIIARASRLRLLESLEECLGFAKLALGQDVFPYGLMSQFPVATQEMTGQDRLASALGSMSLSNLFALLSEGFKDDNDVTELKDMIHTKRLLMQ